MLRTLAQTFVVLSLLVCSFAVNDPADRLYRNGKIFTADARGSIAQAIAIRNGQIVYVGSNEAAAQFIGPSTKIVDLQGGFLMPGLIDGHMHPHEAGLKLQKCNLNYESLTIPEMQQRVQACLDQTRAQEPDGWLEVVSWFQESMRPAGVKTTRAVLDVLKTSRPIIVHSSFGHTVLANSRAIALAKITRTTPDPLGGKIWHDADGTPNGVFEDAAFDVFYELIPKSTPQEDIAAARVAQQAIARQGVTSFLDAAASAESMAAFTSLQSAGDLTVRAHFAPVISPEEASDPERAVAKIVSYHKQYDQSAPQPKPGITVRNAKLFLDGVIAAPALTGAMLEPYRTNAGTAEAPRWVEGQSRGPAVYFHLSRSPKFWCASDAPGSIPTCMLTEMAQSAPDLTPFRSCEKNLAPAMSVPRLLTMRSSAPQIFPAIKNSIRYRSCRCNGKNLLVTRLV